MSLVISISQRFTSFLFTHKVLQLPDELKKLATLATPELMVEEDIMEITIPPHLALIMNETKLIKTRIHAIGHNKA
jgi:hypothetical protein